VERILEGHSTVTTIPVVAKIPDQWSKEKSKARLAGVKVALRESEEIWTNALKVNQPYIKRGGTKRILETVSYPMTKVEAKEKGIVRRSNRRIAFFLFLFFFPRIIKARIFL
jgi:hypothetical protein